MSTSLRTGLPLPSMHYCATITRADTKTQPDFRPGDCGDKKTSGCAWHGFCVREVCENGNRRKLRIAGVWPQSPAEQAGLKPGDVVFKIQAESVCSLLEFNKALQTFESGDVIVVSYSRDHQQQDALLTLGTAPANRFDTTFHLAEKGYAWAQVALGALYVKGLGVSRDLPAAVYWYGQAAEQNDSVAQVLLGTMYIKGHGVEQDLRQGFSLLLKAARQDHASPQMSAAIDSTARTASMKPIQRCPVAEAFEPDERLAL